MISRSQFRRQVKAVLTNASLTLAYVSLLIVMVVMPIDAAETEPATVKLTTTISGNQEQPKTIYILPWQTPVSVIRIPVEGLAKQPNAIAPLDRQQFLRFIAVQSATVSMQSAAQSVNRSEKNN